MNGILDAYLESIKQKEIGEKISLMIQYGLDNYMEMYHLQSEEIIVAMPGIYFRHLQTYFPVFGPVDVGGFTKGKYYGVNIITGYEEAIVIYHKTLVEYKHDVLRIKL